MIDLDALDAESGNVHAVIDTPKGSHNKYKYDEKLDLLRLEKTLPLGHVFPFNFGYVPSTRGEDGDPMDILVLMEEPAFPGCLVMARLIGVIEAGQVEEQKTMRNDRLIGVATVSRPHSDVKTLSDLNESLVHEIEHFFVSYNQIKGKKFRPLTRSGPVRARELVEEGMKQFRRSKRKRARSK